MAPAKLRADAFGAFREPRGGTGVQRAARLPQRVHALAYHRPQLLDQRAVALKLLAWFEKEQEKRDMPWRQAWIDPQEPDADDSESLRERLKRRAYQVWISEIMLQQTRVETVRAYWLSWMQKWPTIEALADATPDDVLAAWRGLGYYSRATRIHEAAKQVVQHPELRGLLPEDADALQALVPGVGRYTAGAISSIVFGHAVPILDGNVARVLSRQTALYADGKAKKTTDALWTAADMLVSALDTGERPAPSAVPGAWNQALMELGRCEARRRPD